MQIAEHFASMGSKVELMPRMSRPPRTKYISYYIDLLTYKQSKYAGKCPDLRIDDIWYEHEGFTTSIARNALKNMLKHGTEQSDRLIFDRPSLDDWYILKRIEDKIGEGKDIEEVWLRDDESVSLFYKKNKD